MTPETGLSRKRRRCLPKRLDYQQRFKNIPPLSEYQDQMKRIVVLAKESGWKAAIRSELTRDPGFYRSCYDQLRPDWIYLLPITGDSKILDIGAGLGILSVLLAERCQQITALDLHDPHIEFLNCLKQEERISNLTIIKADAAHLPFRDASFDIAILNGVLGWVATLSSEDAHPLEIQKRVLKNTCRVLKNGGCLYIGIENRFSYQYFKGHTSHDDLPFCSLLPRRIANIYNRLFRGDEYRTLTHSLRGYKQLLSALF